MKNDERKMEYESSIPRGVLEQPSATRWGEIAFRAPALSPKGAFWSSPAQRAGERSHSAIQPSAPRGRSGAAQRNALGRDRIPRSSPQPQGGVLEQPSATRWGEIAFRAPALSPKGAFWSSPAQRAGERSHSAIQPSAPRGRSGAAQCNALGRDRIPRSSPERAQ